MVAEAGKRSSNIQTHRFIFTIPASCRARQLVLQLVLFIRSQAVYREGTELELTSRARREYRQDRLNAAQPPPPGSPAKPGAAALGKSSRDRGNGTGAGATNLPKRSSGLGAGQMDMATPPASTQAQFGNSNTNQNRPSPAVDNLARNQGRSNNQKEESPGFFAKLSKMLCCGK